MGEGIVFTFPYHENPTQSVWQKLRNAVYIAAPVSQQGLHKYVMGMQWKMLLYNFHSQGFIWLSNKNNHEHF